MPKMKTKKTLVKKIKVTSKDKILRRKTNQNHFNGKDTGAETRAKRGDVRLAKGDEKNVKKALCIN